MIFSWSYAGQKSDFSQRYNRIYYKYNIIPEINIHSCYEVAWISGADHIEMKIFSLYCSPRNLSYHDSKFDIFLLVLFFYIFDHPTSLKQVFFSLEANI